MCGDGEWMVCGTGTFWHVRWKLGRFRGGEARVEISERVHVDGWLRSSEGVMRRGWNMSEHGRVNAYLIFLCLGDSSYIFLGVNKKLFFKWSNDTCLVCITMYSWENLHSNMPSWDILSISVFGLGWLAIINVDSVYLGSTFRNGCTIKTQY